MTQKTSKTKTSLLALALGTLVATSLNAGALTAAEEAAAPKKGFVAKRFSAAKNTANAAAKAGCTNSNLFRLPKSGFVLSNCIKNYPEDMRAFKDELNESVEFNKKHIPALNEEILKEGNQQKPDKKRLKLLQKQLKEATVEKAKMEKQVKAIEETARKVVDDLNATIEKLSGSKYHETKRAKEIPGLKAKKEKIEKASLFPPPLPPRPETKSGSNLHNQPSAHPSPSADIPPPPGDAPDLMHMKKKPTENETANPAANSADIPASPHEEAPKPGSAMPKPQDSGRANLLADIRQGHMGRLKKVESQQELAGTAQVKEPSASGSGGLMGELAAKIGKRRESIAPEEQKKEEKKQDWQD